MFSILIPYDFLRMSLGFPYGVMGNKTFAAYTGVVSKFLLGKYVLQGTFPSDCGGGGEYNNGWRVCGGGSAMTGQRARPQASNHKFPQVL